MDPAAIKALLASTDVEAIRTSALSYDNFEAEDVRTEEQIMKLQMLLWSRALQLQKTTGAADKDISDTYKNMGSVWLRMGENDKAIGQLKHAIEHDDKNARAYELLSEAHCNHTHYEEAIECQEKAIPLLSGAAQTLAYGNLAGIQEAKCEFEDALQILEVAKATMASETDFAAADIYRRMGVIHEKMGEYKQAVSDLTTALELYKKLKGEGHEQTEEIAYLLETCAAYA